MQRDGTACDGHAKRERIRCRKTKPERGLLDKSTGSWSNVNVRCQIPRATGRRGIDEHRSNVHRTFQFAQQYMANDMANEALNTYQIIVKNKMFPNSGRLKVNIGNIYFKKKDYNKAIKYYRMALDQVPSIQKETRINILNNIGVAFIKMGKYDEAMSTFEHCVEERADFKTALNMGNF
ncbi:tetratricopeptide repeat protein [Cooperia oncophora]